MSMIFERRWSRAVWIFDLEDQYLREHRRRSRSYHPRPIGSLQFWLSGEVVAGVPTPYPEPFEMMMVKNPSGYYLFFGEVRTPSRTTRRPAGREHRRAQQLMPGTYAVRITSVLYQEQVRHDIQVPMPNPNDPMSGTPYFFDLTPGYAYPFPETFSYRDDQFVLGCPNQGSVEERPGSPTLLRGGLVTFDGQPLQGAAVQVDVGSRSYTYTTDETGQWVLVFDRTHSTGPVVVRVTPPAGPSVDVDGVCVIRGRETVLHQTALRGWVQRDGIGVPGAVVSLTGQAQAATTRSDGSWSYYFPLSQQDTLLNVTATLPRGGPSQTQSGVLVKSRATRVVDTFKF